MSEMTLNNFYREIAALTAQDLKKQKMLLPPETQSELCCSYCRTHRSLVEALKSDSAGKSAKIVSVIQKAFPREGIINGDFKHLELAQSLEALVDALAVNTEKHFFEGSPSLLTGITHLVKKPVIRWDFIIDAYQLGQSRLWGADAVRIAAALPDQAELAGFFASAHDLELEIIAEIGSFSDLERVMAVDTKVDCFYINNDDLTDENVRDLLQRIPGNAPALLNGSFRQHEQLAEFDCAGFVLDNSSSNNAQWLKNFKKAFK